MKYIIFTDGGSRGNPGYAAAAFIIKTQLNEKLSEEGYYIGLATNNEAEYIAVEKALEYLINSYKELKKAEVEIYADSKLIVSQLSNLWKIKNQRLRDYYARIKLLEKQIGNVEYKHVSRDQNRDADLIVNITLDSQFKGL